MIFQYQRLTCPDRAFLTFDLRSQLARDPFIIDRNKQQLMGERTKENFPLALSLRLCQLQ